MHNPKEIHLLVVYQIPQYLKGTLRGGILFKGKKLTLEDYINANYVGSMVDKRSTSGYCTYLGGNLMT